MQCLLVQEMKPMCATSILYSNQTVLSQHQNSLTTRTLQCLFIRLRMLGHYWTRVRRHRRQNNRGAT